MPVKVEVHVARKEYSCGDLRRACDRKIRRGDPYTQSSYPPGEPPFKSPVWEIIRSCSACMPIAQEVSSVPSRCTVGSSELQCSLAAGHYPATPHDYPIGLF